MAKILVIEDDAELSEVIQDWLTEERHVVDAVDNGAEALDRLKFYSFDLLIVDWMLPGSVSGLDVCKEFRSKGGHTPILILTGKGEIADKEVGLDSGADDYLTKPFHPKELSARIRALLRRSKQALDNVLSARDLRLDTQSHKLSRNGEEIQLLPKEFALLEFLMRHPNQVFSPEALIERVWSTESEASPDTVRVHITKLRSKIDADGEASMIRTIHRVGYKLEA